MTVQKEKSNRLEAFLGRQCGGRETGLWLTGAVSCLTLLAALPFVNWIVLPQPSALLGKLGVGMEQGPFYSGYSLWNLLDFVKKSGQGAIGLFSMILMFLLAATAVLQINYIWKIIRKKEGENTKNKVLGVYRAGGWAQLLSIITLLAAAVYTGFANKKFGTDGFGMSGIVPVLFIMAIASWLIIKVMEEAAFRVYREHGFWKEVRKNWVLFLMLVPTFIYFMINNYIPMAGVYYAFTSFNFRDGLWASPFVGFKNFEFLVKADLFRLTRNTILYNLVFIGLGNILQIIFAIFVSRVSSRWFKKTTQTLMFMPYFVSFVILKVLVYNIFEYQYGLVNNIITSMGGTRIDFYNTPAYWPVFITLFYLWKNIGYGMVVYLATIMGIDSELYEAARVDGANVFQQIFYITLPLLKPTFIILLLYALGGIMKGQFELFYQLVGNNGVLYNITDIFDTYVYRITTTEPLSIGLGTAAGLYQSLFGFAVVMLTNFIVKRKNPDYALF